MLNVFVKLHQDVEVNVPIEDLIQEICEGRVENQYNTVAKLISCLDPDPDRLDPRNRTIVRDWLQKQLNKFTV